MGLFSGSFWKDPFRNILDVYQIPLNLVGIETPSQRRDKKIDSKNAESRTRAGAQAAVKQALLDQELAAFKGQAESLAAIRRRKGFLSTILSGLRSAPASRDDDKLKGTFG